MTIYSPEKIEKYFEKITGEKVYGREARNICTAVYIAANFIAYERENFYKERLEEMDKRDKKQGER